MKEHHRGFRSLFFVNLPSTKIQNDINWTYFEYQLMHRHYADQSSQLQSTFYHLIFKKVPKWRLRILSGLSGSEAYWTHSLNIHAYLRQHALCHPSAAFPNNPASSAARTLDTHLYSLLDCSPIRNVDCWWQYDSFRRRSLPLSPCCQ